MRAKYIAIGLLVAGSGIEFEDRGIQSLKGVNADQDAGIKIVLRALEEPLRQIVQNTGDEPSVVVNKVRDLIREDVPDDDDTLPIGSARIVRAAGQD